MHRNSVLNQKTYSNICNRQVWRVEDGQDDLGWLCSSLDRRYLRLEWWGRLGRRLDIRNVASVHGLQCYVLFGYKQYSTLLYKKKTLFPCMLHPGVKGGRWPGPIVTLLNYEDGYETGMTKETKEVDWYCSSWIQIMIKCPVYILLSHSVSNLQRLGYILH